MGPHIWNFGKTLYRGTPLCNAFRPRPDRVSPQPIHIPTTRQCLSDSLQNEAFPSWQTIHLRSKQKHLRSTAPVGHAPHDPKVACGVNWQNLCQVVARMVLKGPVRLVFPRGTSAAGRFHSGHLAVDASKLLRRPFWRTAPTERSPDSTIISLPA